MFEVGDTVYIFGRKKLKAKILEEIPSKDHQRRYLVGMFEGRWWFSGSIPAERSPYAGDMYVKTIAANACNLRKEPKD